MTLYPDTNLLEWKVAAEELASGLFTWYGATSNKGGNLVDITNAVTTPIPSDAWLFASVALALVVLRRRKNEP